MLGWEVELDCGWASGSRARRCGWPAEVLDRGRSPPQSRWRALGALLLHTFQTVACACACAQLTLTPAQQQLLLQQAQAQAQLLAAAVQQHSASQQHSAAGATISASAATPMTQIPLSQPIQIAQVSGSGGRGTGGRQKRAGFQWCSIHPRVVGVGPSGPEKLRLGKDTAAFLAATELEITRLFANLSWYYKHITDYLNNWLFIWSDNSWVISWHISGAEDDCIYFN